jgi:hypothetical protein
VKTSREVAGQEPDRQDGGQAFWLDGSGMAAGSDPYGPVGSRRDWDGTASQCCAMLWCLNGGARR